MSARTEYRGREATRRERDLSRRIARSRKRETVRKFGGAARAAK